MNSKTTPSRGKRTSPSPCSPTIDELRKAVAYYERLHADARRAIDIAATFSLEMKEQLIQARQRLAHAEVEANNGVSDSMPKRKP